MLEAKFRDKISYIISPLARKIASLGITANLVTILGFIINIAAGICFGLEHPVWAGLLLLLGSSFDMMDGAVARARTITNSSGALLDSVMDRYSEAAVLLGAVIYFYLKKSIYGVAFTLCALEGSILVSYVRARAEGLGIECKVGLMQRPERITLLGIGLIAHGIVFKWIGPVQANIIITAVIGILAVTSNGTALHRLIYSFNRLKEEKNLQ